MLARDAKVSKIPERLVMSKIIFDVPSDRVAGRETKIAFLAIQLSKYRNLSTVTGMSIMSCLPAWFSIHKIADLGMQEVVSQ